LRRYLTPAPSNPAHTFVAPNYVRSHAIVQAAIAHHRAVYLSRSEARIGGTLRIAGIQPRWCRPEDYAWDRRTALTLHLESLVEVPLRWQLTGTDDEKDILYGLGMGFQLRTDAVALLRPSSTDPGATSFTSFTARIVDTYDFNPDEHITCPNPDFGSSRANAVRPSDETLVFYHSNAARLERAGRAQVYAVRSDAWVPPGTLWSPGSADLTCERAWRPW